MSQAVLSYQLAASQGHRLAQYRYARCLLQGPASEGAPKRQRAVSMLKQAADSGLREVSAQAGCLLEHVGPGRDQDNISPSSLAIGSSFPRGAFHQGATPG